MISVIAEHSVDLDLLPKEANILDLGCRGFLFTKAMRQLGHKVWAVDIDQLNEGQAYYQVAISNYDGHCGVKHTNDPQGTMIKQGDAINCYRLETFSQHCQVSFWDLIKMDIEGSEYEVIMDMEDPPSKQLSIEFHLHTGIYNKAQMKDMERQLEWFGYQAVSHTMSNQHGAGFNYWDSLFILK